MAESPSRILSKEAIEKLAACGDRFELISSMLKHLPKGTRRIADVEKVGPANVDKCAMPLHEWDRVTKGRESNGQCKGFFFTSFGQKNSFRRCEAVAEELCGLCKNMRENARKSGMDVVTAKSQPEYEVQQKALCTRPGVTACSRWWEEQSNQMKKELKLKKDYPFFSAQEMITMLMIDAKVIFANGGKGGRVYKRSAVIVEAQDKYLRECMESALIILKYETKKQFKKRLGRLVLVAGKVEEQMLDANVGSDTFQVGAIQTPDIVREELTRAARISERTEKAALHFSVHVKRLIDWAVEREKMKTPIESSEGSPALSVKSETDKKLAGEKPKLLMMKVSADSGKEEGTDVPVFKAYEIRESTIKGAGQGFFLREGAEHNEEIARYSGKLLSRAEAEASDSQYMIKISKSKFLCANGENEWEGKKLNCARKGGRVVNARFQANGQCNFCEKSGRYWIKVFAVGRIDPGEEAFVDYNNSFWYKTGSTNEFENLPTPKSNYVPPEEVEDSESSWNPVDEGLATKLKFESPGNSPRQAEEHEEGDKGLKQVALRRSQRLKSGRKEKEEEKEDDEHAEQTKADAEGGKEDKRDDKEEEETREQQERISGVGRKKMSGPMSKIYAVSVGRCVGLFKSVVRMQASVLEYPMEQHR